MSYINLYYNDQFGYIIASYTHVRDSIIYTVIDPVIYAGPSTTKHELAKYIEEGLYKSETSELAERNQMGKYKFWQVKNIKSFSVFSKRFQCIEVKKSTDYYTISVMLRCPDGSYTRSKNKEDTYQAPVSADYETIAEIAMNVFGTIPAIQIENN